MDGAYEAVRVPIPIKAEAAFCNSRGRIESIGRGFETGNELPAIFIGLAQRECLVAPIQGFITEYGQVYSNGQTQYQAVGVSARRGGRTSLWFLIPVFSA